MMSASRPALASTHACLQFFAPNLFSHSQTSCSKIFLCSSPSSKTQTVVCLCLISESFQTSCSKTFLCSSPSSKTQTVVCLCLIAPSLFKHPALKPSFAAALLQSLQPTPNV